MRSMLLTKLAFHNIEVNGKIYANNLKFYFFFTQDDIKQKINSKKANKYTSQERDHGKRIKLCIVGPLIDFFPAF